MRGSWATHVCLFQSLQALATLLKTFNVQECSLPRSRFVSMLISQEHCVTRKRMAARETDYPEWGCGKISALAP